jgi:hypothetical protein
VGHDEVPGQYRRAHATTGWIGELMVGVGVNSVRCMRERGDPLIVERGGRAVLIGVNSFSLSDCDLPQVFAELSGPQLAWVAS